MALVNGRLHAAHVTSFIDRRSLVIGQNLADGSWHTVRVNVTSGNIVIGIDSLHSTLAPSGSQAITDLQDTLYLGTLFQSIQFQTLGIALSSVFATFGGCSRNVTVNGQVFTFDTAQRSGRFPLPHPGCRKNDNCAPDSCANEGTCVASWTGFHCQCSNDFGGSRCENGKEMILKELNPSVNDQEE